MKFARWNFIDLFAKIKEFVQLDPKKIFRFFYIDVK